MEIESNKIYIKARRQYINNKSEKKSFDLLTRAKLWLLLLLVLLRTKIFNILIDF